MHPQPEPVKALALLLREEPKPTQLEITVLPVEENVSYPINAFIKVDVHLGLNSSDLPRLARDFQKEYKTLRALFRAENYCSQIQSSEDGANVDEEKWRPLVTRVMDATACLLLVCPDNSTAWADRRRAVLLLSADDDNKESFYREELKFLNLLFTQHSKKPSSWAYRKWIYRRLIEQSSSFRTEEEWNKLFEWTKEEVRICISVAEHFPKNYYSWTHRSFVSKLAYHTWCKIASETTENANSVGSLLLYNFLEGEVNSIEPWLKRHVSDHSAAHYGAEILKLLLTFGLRDDGYRGDTSLSPQEWGLSLVKGMLTSSYTLLQNFQAHEVIWIWRRLCGCLFLKVIDGTLSQGETTNITPANLKSMKDFINDEVIGNAKKLTDGLDPEKSCLDNDEKRLFRRYSAKYVLWIVHQIKRCRCKDEMFDLFEAQACVEKLSRILYDGNSGGINIGGYLPQLNKSI